MNNTAHTPRRTDSTAAPIPAPRTITRRIGHSNYKINVHFSDTSRETMNDKIMRLIRNEATNGKAAGL